MVCETYNAEQYRIVRLEEGEDWMSEVKDNIRPGWERTGSRSVRRDVRSVGWTLVER